MRRGGRKNSRAGITTVVTSAIMLVAVALMGSGVVVWGNSNIFGNERTLASSYSTNIDKISENLVIEKIWFGTSPQKFVNITMNNQGSVGLNVTQIQFSTSSTTTQYHFGNQIILPQKSSSVQILYGYNDNILTNIQLTTSRGSTFTAQTLPP